MTTTLPTAPIVRRSFGGDKTWTRDRIRALRTAMNATQAELADAIAAITGQRPNVVTISRWETEAKSPTYLYAAALLQLEQRVAGKETGQ